MPEGRRVFTALRQLTNVDTGGLTPALDFSKANAASSRQTYIQSVSSKVAGGLTIVSGPAEGAPAKGY